MQNFSQRLAHAIRIADKPKGDLAKHCGVALSSVSRWLAGVTPRADVVKEIAAFLSADVNWLLYGDGNFAETPKAEDVASQISESEALYRAKPLTQSVASAAQNSDPMTLWERVAATADAVARLPEPSIRLKIGGDIIEMIRAAMEKDQQTVDQRSV